MDARSSRPLLGSPEEVVMRTFIVFSVVVLVAAPGIRAGARLAVAERPVRWSRVGASGGG